MRAEAARVVTSAEELEGGTRFLTPGLPDVWDLNFGWLDSAAGDWWQDLPQVVFAEEGLAPPDWETTRLDVMAWRGGAPAVTDAVTEVDAAAQAPVRASLDREQGRPPALAEQLGRASRLREARAGKRSFARLAGGEPVAVADLHSDGVVAQVEDVVTAPGARGRGYGREVVLGTVAAAVPAHELVFLVVEADGPVAWYRTMGFERVGGYFSARSRRSSARSVEPCR